MATRQTTAITATEDYIDSRDVIARLDYLEDEAEECVECKADTCEDGEHAEYIALKAFAEEGQQAEDWQDGAQFIRDSYFEDFAEELAGDIGAIDPKATWPLNCIDWEQAARKLQSSYFSVEFDGVTYWTR
jgi:hypothetical protein